MRTTRAWRMGNRQGFVDGFRQGHHLGCCEAIRQRTPPVAGVRRDMHVMLVPTGLWAYRPIDDGVADALRALARDVTVAAAANDPVAQAGALRPDLVLVINPLETLRGEQVEAIRGMGIRTAVWMTDDPYYSDVSLALAPIYDHVFTLDAGCVPHYRERGVSAHHVPLGVNPQLYQPRRAPLVNRFDVVFIGSAFQNRVRFFDEIAGYLASKHAFISGYWWERLANFETLKGRIHNGYWISPEETSVYYSGAGIVINLHRGEDETNRNTLGIAAVSANPRTFEIAACGAFQLTDVRADLGSYYEPGREIATYSTPAELMAQIEHYLAHPEDRHRIALRGLERTLREHTFVSRLERILALIGV
jgi:spore maturation protein CgeB